MKILLIMPDFFDYPQVISKELEDMGYEVDFFDDRPSTNTWIKAAIRINRNIVKECIKKYFANVMQSIKNKRYDIVFLISGQSLSFDADMIAEIRKSQPGSKFVLYQWDSMRNFPYIRVMHKFFDKCYSFDREDCEQNPKLSFMPLFYSRIYEEIGNVKKSEYVYDFCFVGTAHPQKYKFVSMMSDQLKEVYPNQFIYYFFPSPIVYFYRKIRDPELRNSHFKEFHYVPINGEEMNQLFLNSRCILDSPQAGQSGLTIRVLEALGAKKKLITTNKDIKNYDFYKEENIYIYDGNIDLDHVFFKKTYVELERDIYENYSLRRWLERIMS
ncbi:MAG: hypothetical protein HFG62_01920 [Lachnospiraceae bacterium]|nr:hypothetical protein [Lachnospiraceae bacterium]